MAEQWRVVERVSDADLEFLVREAAPEAKDRERLKQLVQEDPFMATNYLHASRQRLFRMGER